MNADLKVWLNGSFIPWQDATVPLLSHGFSRGSAIFEVFGIHPGPDGPAAFRMDQHLDRLENSACALGMKLGQSKETIARAVGEVVKANRVERGLIKILAYWGEEAVINLILESDLDVAIFAIPETDDLGLDSTEPISACLSTWCKLHPRTVPVSAKACANYLNGYLARRDANSRGFNVGLMAGTDGFLAEGSTESVFVVHDGVLKTPPLGRVLNSISRLSILEAAPAAGITVSEEPLPASALEEADEIFVCHTGIKAWPVGRFEDRTLAAPGPVTQQIAQLMSDITHFKDERFRHWFQPL